MYMNERRVVLIICIQYMYIYIYIYAYMIHVWCMHTWHVCNVVGKKGLYDFSGSSPATCRSSWAAPQLNFLAPLELELELSRSAAQTPLPCPALPCSAPYIPNYSTLVYIHVQWNQRRKEHTCDDFLTSNFHRFLFWDHLWRAFDASCVLGVL